MDFGSTPVDPTTLSNSPFDVQGFKNLLSNLKQSKEEQKNKAVPLYEETTNGF
jgi:hypothetical protein